MVKKKNLSNCSWLWHTQEKFSKQRLTVGTDHSLKDLGHRNVMESHQLKAKDPNRVTVLQIRLNGFWGEYMFTRKKKRIQSLLYSSRVYLWTHSCHCSGSQFPYLNLVSDRYSQLLWSSGTFAVCIEFAGNKAPYTIYFCLEFIAHSTKFCSYP